MRIAALALALTVACTTVPAATAPADPSPEATAVRTAAPAATAAPAPTAAVAAVPEPPRVLRTIGGVEFEAVDSAADLFVEAAIGRDDGAVIGAQVASDIADVEREFARPFAHRPVVYVFATTASYARGMAGIFGYPPATATFIAESSVSFFEPPLRIIGVNWEAVGERRPVASIRHELVHDMTLDACGRYCHLVPAWLNEGQARLAEALIAGSEWRLARVRYEAASMAVTDTLIPLRDLVSQHAWNSLTDWAGYYKYQQAARTVELLREDVGGSSPIARVYERIARGESVAQAYAALTGRSFDAFLAGLPARIAAPAPGPSVVATTSAGAPRAAFLVHGFPPSSPVTVRIEGTRAAMEWMLTVSPFGAAFEAVPGDLPRGRYTITATSPAAAATVTATRR
ncbi:MAG TPA: hypothetical protein VFM93_05460 [Candidatus Limnocylindria bacterium]|nr:hypothetical protein [Candidatus Limnocylindria bacterium]